MADAKPLPQVNPDNRPFWQGCREHLLKIQKCGNCGRLRWPPGFLCPGCLSPEAEWITVTGKGRVYTFAVYHQAFQPGFQEDLPYVVAIVELDDGPRMMTNIIDCDPAGVACDMPVEVAWADRNDEFSIPCFRPIRQGN